MMAMEVIRVTRGLYELISSGTGIVGLFDAWISGVSATGGCATDITNDWDGTYPDACGEAVTVEFTATDTVCGDSDVCSATFTVEVRPCSHHLSSGSDGNPVKIKQI